LFAQRYAETIVLSVAPRAHGSRAGRKWDHHEFQRLGTRRLDSAGVHMKNNERRPDQDGRGEDGA